MPKSLMDLQLKETGQLTGACWPTCLERTNDREVLASYKIILQQGVVLLKCIQQPQVKAWLNGSLTGKRSRSRLISQEMVNWLRATREELQERIA